MDADVGHAALTTVPPTGDPAPSAARGPRGVAVLGSTGSIGTAALRVLDRHRDRFRVVALTGFSNGALLREQTARWTPAFSTLAGGGDLRADRPHEGSASLVEAATRDDVDIVINAVVGAAGLQATLAALARGKRVALANKESLVMAGPLMLDAARRGGGQIVPIDSEHSAILQCVTGRRSADVTRLVLTASGGPFRDWPADRIAGATAEAALRHPTWRMGRKITVDSATLANKALEVVEAHFLFGIPYDRIDVVVHPQSIVHSLVEFPDGGVLAQLGVPDMELPILYSLTHPDRLADDGVPRLDLVSASPLTFEPVSESRFPMLGLGVAAGRSGGAAPAVFNAANEEAVALFLAGRLDFGDMPAAVDSALAALGECPAPSLEALLKADDAARRIVRERHA